VTVPVSAKTGVGGFVFPGDRVDMMLTQSVDATDGGATLNATETILRNLRVLATDQATETTTTPDGKTVVRAVRTVTLEVTPRIAEKIQVAGTIGTLSLSLRSIADNQSELERAIASGEVDVPDNASKEDEEKVLQQAMARPQDGASSFVTGGDVSRFQRTALPRPGAPAGAVPGVPAGPTGPTVRVTRGKATTVEAVGRGAGAMLDRQAQGTANFGRISGVGMSTLR
jgi:pilus assembly protein CpaB